MHCQRAGNTGVMSSSLEISCSELDECMISCATPMTAGSVNDAKAPGRLPRHAPQLDALISFTFIHVGHDQVAPGEVKNWGCASSFVVPVHLSGILNASGTIFRSYDIELLSTPKLLGFSETFTNVPI